MQTFREGLQFGKQERGPLKCYNRRTYTHIHTYTHTSTQILADS